MYAVSELKHQLDMFQCAKVLLPLNQLIPLSSQCVIANPDERSVLAGSALRQTLVVLHWQLGSNQRHNIRWAEVTWLPVCVEEIYWRLSRVAPVFVVSYCLEHIFQIRHVCTNLQVEFKMSNISSNSGIGQAHYICAATKIDFARAVECVFLVVDLRCEGVEVFRDETDRDEPPAEDIFVSVCVDCEWGTEETAEDFDVEFCGEVAKVGEGRRGHGGR
jgi:hypothetical protein